MYDLTASEKANKTALLLVHERYSKRLAPFVKSSKTRYDYVKDEINRIIADVCNETGADVAWVTERFGALDAVLVDNKNVKREDLNSSPEPDSPYTTNSEAPIEGIVTTDVADRGDVPGAGREEALEADAKQDLSEETADAPSGETEVDNKTASASCFRCGKEKTASETVCKTCNYELLKLALPQPDGTDGSMGIGAGAPGPGIAELPQSVNPNIPYACKLCGAQGDREEILSHINRDHADVLQRQEMSTDNMGQDNLGVAAPLANIKEAFDPNYLYGLATGMNLATTAIVIATTNWDSVRQHASEDLQRLFRWIRAKSGERESAAPPTNEPGFKPGGWFDWPDNNGLIQQVEQILESDPKLAAELQRLIQQLGIQPTGTTKEAINNYCSNCGTVGSMFLNAQGQPECKKCGSDGRKQPGVKNMLRRVDLTRINPFASEKTADVPQPTDQAAEVQPLPESPGDKFDDYVQTLAETAAARKFSQITDEDIHAIASQVGASPDEVKQMIKVVAVFGDQVGVNGQLGGDPTPPEGYEETSAQGLSGQQPTHEALVPTDLVIQTVANDLNMSSDLAYNMVRDKYGDDLPDKYHASISGQVHYYLPSGMAGNQQPQDPQVGPTAPPAPQMQPSVQQPQQPLQPTM